MFFLEAYLQLCRHQLHRILGGMHQGLFWGRGWAASVWAQLAASWEIKMHACVCVVGG